MFQLRSKHQRTRDIYILCGFQIHILYTVVVFNQVDWSLLILLGLPDDNDGEHIALPFLRGCHTVGTAIL